MLYQLLAPHGDVLQFFNLFNYITFRTGGATMTAFLISLLIGPSVIRWLKSKQGAGQPIRQDGPETHFKKQGTPTMGGLMIIFSVCLSSCLWADIKNPYLWIVLVTFLGFGMIGFADDYKKLIGRSHEGLSGKIRLTLETLIAGSAIMAFIHVTSGPMAHGLTIPFLKEIVINLSWFIVPFAILVIVGTANAVNLTDGLDGLAIGPVMIAAACFGIIAYVTGHVQFAEYLQLHPMPGVGEVSIFCGALIGAGLGFLWYNAPPAMVFMGDTGSLATGGALGALAVVTKHELVLAIIGGVFVLETVSVIVQVASFKLTGKRIFRMAPIHHHYEKKGWSEPTIVIRFWIIALIFAMIGLATLKLR